MLLGADYAPDARIVAFEPNPRILPYLRRTIAESGLDVELHPLAVAAVEGVVGFDIDEEWSGTSGIHGERGLGHAITTLDVGVTTLDRALADIGPGPCCIKIDVEGFEVEVLAGAREVLSAHSAWAIMIEIEHQDLEIISDWVGRYAVFLFDAVSDALVKVTAPGVEAIAALLASGEVHTQDAVIISDGLLHELAGRPDAEGLDGATQWRIAAEARSVGLRDAQVRIAGLDAELRDLRASHSWRITAPVRALTRLVRGR